MKGIGALIEAREKLLFQLRVHRQGGINATEEKILKSLSDVTFDIERMGVGIITGQKLDRLDLQKHEVIAWQEVDDIEFHNRILELYGDAYEYEGEIIRKMEVMAGYGKGYTEEK